MSGGNVVPLPLGGEVGEDGRVEPAHPARRGRVAARRARCARAAPAARPAGRSRRRHSAATYSRAGGLRAGDVRWPRRPRARRRRRARRAAGDGRGDGAGTFTVGILNEVDSFNPFLGIEAESYEMWALTYDYMITYSMEDMSPEPGLAESWETSDDGLTWTFDIREGVMWSDGEPLTAADIAFTYSRIIDGGPEASTWGSYLTSVDDGRGAGRHHGRADAGEAQRGPAAAADPDRARARLVEHRREGGQDLPGRADRRPARGRVRPVPAGRGHRRRLDVPLRAQPRLLAGRRRTSTRSSSASTRPRTRWSRR